MGWECKGRTGGGEIGARKEGEVGEGNGGGSEMGWLWGRWGEGEEGR